MNSEGSYLLGAFFMPEGFVHGVIPVFPLLSCPQLFLTLHRFSYPINFNGVSICII